jgi:hypothetical protein
VQQSNTPFVFVVSLQYKQGLLAGSTERVAEIYFHPTGV